MRSPIQAMLWELWRITRTEIVLKFAFGVVGSLVAIAFCAALAPSDDAQRYERTKEFGAVIAMVLLVLPYLPGWMSIFRGKWRPGFPFYLLYTRPVRTAVIVGLPMAYLTAVPSVIYLVSALLLRVTSGYPFPLLSVAVWIAALNLMYLAISWSTRSMFVLMLGALVVSVRWFRFAVYRLTSFPDGFDWHDSPKLWPTIFDFPLGDYALVALIGLVSLGIALAGVARQRHGGAWVTMPRRVWWARLPEWFLNLGGYPCPISSATWAQVWFELRASGMGILLIGLAIASLTPLVFAVSVPGARFRTSAVSWTLMSVMAALFVGTNSGFGLRYKKGGLYRDEFDATLAVCSARLAGIKVIVRSVCALAVLIALFVSVRGSMSFIAVGKVKPLSRSLPAIEEILGALTGYQLVALAVVLFIGFTAMGAVHASFWAIWVRYPRRVNIAISLLLLFGLALALLALAGVNGVEFVTGVALFIAAMSMVPATVYLLWSGLAQRLLTLPYVCSAFVVSAVFAVAWLTVLPGVGVQLSEMPTPAAVLMLLPALLPLLGSMLAPWSLDRVRHM